jgi:hypothetical protein
VEKRLVAGRQLEAERGLAGEALNPGVGVRRIGRSKMKYEQVNTKWKNSRLIELAIQPKDVPAPTEISRRINTP